MQFEQDPLLSCALEPASRLQLIDLHVGMAVGQVETPTAPLMFAPMRRKSKVNVLPSGNLTPPLEG
jgi:hypothetical protein